MSDQTINLLPKREKRVTDKLLYFLLHYFRYVIVVTQIVVIGVFFYRFSEDQKIIDQKESFKQKQQILNITLPLVEEAEAVQRKTLQIDELLSNQDTFIERFDYVISVVPQDIVLIGFEVGETAIKLNGTSQGLLSVRSLNKRLQQRKEFSNARIITVERNDIGGFLFSISIDFVTQNVKEG
ncbi:hypothetical protein A3F34_01080 [Candidatus Roizmanbacteria bacterium RIFCSPHIGHO2_12_FULL_44_10]|uniref:Fimbrial assembly protein n=1 Tax=Candidatus Roizmanbacteria bacterium RIFCSPHIGHO2_12_FULL_44_10 TaxID=1802054 RepID=A0A1F7I8V5_9BACT|nr:MAG: hypothetical protein A3F34_01080 [Candidatus Roizmanbacteria bacterium RIFCSPHIGHO2_12_FULL_44_10]